MMSKLYTGGFSKAHIEARNYLKGFYEQAKENMRVEQFRHGAKTRLD